MTDKKYSDQDLEFIEISRRVKAAARNILIKNRKKRSMSPVAKVIFEEAITNTITYAEDVANDMEVSSRKDYYGYWDAYYGS